MRTAHRIGLTALALAAAAPACASAAHAVPEPSDAILFLLGAAGVVIGRRLQARKRD